MPRKLPWALDNAQDVKKTSVSRQPRLEKKHTPSPEAKPKHQHSGSAERTPIKTPHHEQGNTQGRRNSSSPVPAQPTIEFMKQGYNADDIYVMVEDEFYSIAQSFTAHLHHAEYKRLMQKARTVPPRPPPDLTESMPSDVRLKLTRDRLDQKQKKAVEDMLGVSSLKSADDEDMYEPRIDDPWSGTSLASLMTSGSQQKTSLVGLGGVPSTTRAALGYEKSTLSDPARRKQKDTNSKKANREPLTSPIPSSRNQSRSTSMRRAIDDLVASDDDDDDDIIEIKSPYPAAAAAASRTKNQPSTSKPTRSLIDDLESPSPPPSYPSSDNADDKHPNPLHHRRRPHSSSTTTATAHGKSGSTTTQNQKRKADNLRGKDKRSRLDEVPVFLIS